MTYRKFTLHASLALVVVALAGGAAAYIIADWRARRAAEADEQPAARPRPVSDGTMPVRVGAAARKNLGVVSKPLRLTDYWRKIDVPGIVTDRPGVSDRGVVAPVTGIVTHVYAHPGDAIEPGAPLFALRLVSESLHASQLELFKATKEIEIARQQKRRLEGLAQTGAVAGTRLIEIENQIERMDVNVQAYRQDLLARGLTPERIDAAALGDFVTEIVVAAPDQEALEADAPVQTSIVESAPSPLPVRFELQALKVELGQQVEAGEVLCVLADHRRLLIEGRGFKKDMPLIQQAAQEGLPVEVAFDVPEGPDWPALPTKLRIGHVANVIDPANRTFAFYLPLDNHAQAYTQDGQDRLIWRFRPGDRVRLSVAVDKIEDVFVLPQAALVREGPEAYVFRQNGDLFDRISVHVLHEDADSVVLAGDGLRKGAFIAQNSAASLNRVLKAQLASGVPTNVHVHADGTVHEAH